MMKGAKAYKSHSIETSDPGKVLVALYDGFIKECHVAKHGFENNQRARAGEAISNAIGIVGELRASLDPKKGDEELAERLSAIYDFVSDSLLQINRHKDLERLDEIIDLMSGLREAWSEAASKVKQDGLSQAINESAD